MLKLLRKENILDSIATAGAEYDNESARIQTIVREEQKLFEDFCEAKRNNMNDTELVKRVEHIPIEYARRTSLTDNELKKYWSKFTTPKCSVYYDKLVCLNGLVLDWRDGNERNE